MCARSGTQVIEARSVDDGIIVEPPSNELTKFHVAEDFTAGGDAVSEAEFVQKRWGYHFEPRMLTL